MIELNRHIEILLLDNDCVIVPGLGGFMAHHVDARYDEADGVFLPPLRTLGFNPQLKLNDSLLVQSYVEAYEISYPEALRRIETEVDELKQRLENEGSYELDDIGTLSVNAEGNYVFEPCEAGILTPSLYGLSSFEMKPLVSDVVSKEVNTENKGLSSNLLPHSVEVKDNAAEDIPDTTVDEEDSDNTIKIKVAWVRNAVAVAAAIMAFFIFTTPITNSVNDGLSSANIQKSEFMSIVPKAITLEGNNAVDSPVAKAMDVAKATERLDSSARAKAKSLAERKPSADSSSVKTIAKDYCIVLASHVTLRNAEAFVEKLHKDGFDEASTYKHGNVVKVVYGQYEDEESALKDLRKMRDNEYFEQSWIYKKR